MVRLMDQFRSGDRQAAGELVALFYPELRRLAAAYMQRERSDHSWQPTLLVNELFMELIKIKGLKAGSSDPELEKTEFFRLAGFLMKRLLIHHARPASQRAIHLELEELAEVRNSNDDLRQVEDTLDALAAIDSRVRSVVQMKVFEGLPTEQIAKSLGCSPRTVSRSWTFARHWLQSNL
jgi:RNA polymerase sigma factor (TIGR02999 family)